MQILIICVPSVFARTAAVWYASDEMYVTAMHYIEAERAAGSTICLPDSPLETGKVDVLYVIGHGWREGSSGGVTVYVDGIERRLPFKVLLNTAKRIGTDCVIVDSCYSGLAVDAAEDNGIGISVIAGCAKDELMPVSSEGSLFSVMWSPGVVPEDEYSVKGHVIHPKILSTHDSTFRDIMISKLGIDSLPVGRGEVRPVELPSVDDRTQVPKEHDSDMREAGTVQGAASDDRSRDLDTGRLDAR